MSAVARLGLIGLVLAGVSCGGGGTEPSGGGPATVDVVLNTPNADDGGLLLAVTGGTVTSAVAAGYEMTSTAPGVSGVTLLVRGTITDGVVARLTVPKRSLLGQYHATVLQAAARGPSYQQRSTAGYQVQLVAP